MPTYCGNNAIHPNLLDGSKILGTRYSCLKKGIGVGLNLPYDENYSHPYEPIDQTQIYCGNNNILPQNYDRFGNLPQCLQKGVAIGKIQKVQRGPPSNSYNLKYIILLIFAILLFIFLYKTKPKILIKKNQDNINYINWEKFALIYFEILILFYLFLFYLIK